MGELFIKDPDALLDYMVDWSTWLGNDTIATSVWTVPSGITKSNDTKTPKTATIWLSGGTVGQRYDITNRITTDGGRTDDRTMSIVIEHK